MSYTQRTTLATFGGAILGLLLGISAVSFAQSPSESPGDTPFPFTSSLCVDVLGEPPVEGWNPTSLREALVDGTATLTGVGDPALCAPAATPAPTAEPTPEPTDAPTPVAGAPLQAFLDQSVPGLGHMADYFTEMGELDVDTASMAELKRPFAGMRTTATNQLAWMDDHSPQPCYQSLWDTMHQMWTYILNASRLVLRGLAEYDASAITRATDILGKGTDLITEMNDTEAIAAARENCSYDPGLSA